jgi:hypothetical protein
MNQGVLGFPRGKLGAALLGLPVGQLLPDVPEAAQAIADTSNSAGVVVTSNVTANLKGSWSQLAVAEFDANLVYLQFDALTNTRRFLLDVGIGPVGSEQVVVENIHFASGASTPTCYGITLPLRVRAGDRLSARCQCSTGANTCDVTGMLFSRAWPDAYPFQALLGKFETWGRDLNNSGGTNLDPGAVANTKGAWTTLISPSGASGGPVLDDWKALYVMVSNQGNTVMTNAHNLIDVGYGSDGDPSDTHPVNKIVVPDLKLRAAATGDCWWPVIQGPYPAYVPAGSRLVVRMSSDITDATDRKCDIVVMGVA